jgi:hypothetical protein
VHTAHTPAVGLAEPGWDPRTPFLPGNSGGFPAELELEPLQAHDFTRSPDSSIPASMHLHNVAAAMEGHRKVWCENQAECSG